MCVPQENSLKKFFIQGKSQEDRDIINKQTTTRTIEE